MATSHVRSFKIRPELRVVPTDPGQRGHQHSTSPISWAPCENRTARIWLFSTWAFRTCRPLDARGITNTCSWSIALRCGKALTACEWTMRLRGSVVNVSLLTRLAQTASGVGSPCYLQFSPNTLRMMSPAGRDGVQVWTTLDVNTVFTNFKIESHNNNEITVEVSAESLARVLRSAVGALEVMLRLGKRDREPLLSWSIAMTSQNGTRLDVVQELVVRILRASELALIVEPMCPTPDVRGRSILDDRLASYDACLHIRCILSCRLYRKCMR